MFAQVGIPKEILTDWGANFSYRLMAKLCKLLNIQALKTSVYHPQTDGLVKSFNGTLKSMLCKFMDDDPQHWDKLLPDLPFTIREVPQVSKGFSPFELSFRRQPRGILDLLHKTWEEQESRVTGSVPYILQLREYLKRLGGFAHDNLMKA